jgi:23S rRNA (adenine2030-N6)-methyltransferase
VLIDPPFEAADEFQRLERGVRAAMDRFETGTYLIWYPVKEPRSVGRWLGGMSRVLGSAALAAELDVGLTPGSTGLHRAGLLIINPPFGLREVLERAVPGLARRLAQGQNPHAQIADIPPTGADGRPR